jgi:hypothetical protein
VTVQVIQSPAAIAVLHWPDEHPRQDQPVICSAADERTAAHISTGAHLHTLCAELALTHR